MYADRLFFYRKNIEVDFFVPDEGMAVRASLSLNDQETLRREVSALVKLNAYHPLKTMVIVTLDESRVIEDKSDARIEVVPVWRWMLGAFLVDVSHEDAEGHKQSKAGGR